MFPFNVEKALNGAVCVTRSGKPAARLSVQLTEWSLPNGLYLSGEIDHGDVLLGVMWFLNGTDRNNSDVGTNDLFMANREDSSAGFSDDKMKNMYDTLKLPRKVVLNILQSILQGRRYTHLFSQCINRWRQHLQFNLPNCELFILNRFYDHFSEGKTDRLQSANTQDEVANWHWRQTMVHVVDEAAHYVGASVNEPLMPMPLSGESEKSFLRRCQAQGLRIDTGRLSSLSVKRLGVTPPGCLTCNGAKVITLFTGTAACPDCCK